MKAVFFDAGLTLLRANPSLGEVYTIVTRKFDREISPLDFDRAAEQAFHEVAAEHRHQGDEGLKTSEELERTSWIGHARRVVDAIPEMAGVEFDAWFDDLYEAFGSPEHWVPFQDAAPALHGLKEMGLKLAVVSNWDQRLHPILEAGGLTKWFDAVIVSSEVGWRKPHPAIFSAALEALDVAASDVIHVGDSRGDDVLGARMSGLTPYLIDRDCDEARGEGVVRSLGELPRLLK
ncbi:MAG: HAD-IA family hydrolase [Planctomycetota bacterium]|jgi:putative hydrolase of the HAD superfamily